MRLITESALEGICRGWDGQTEFRLANGEVWQQCAFRLRALYLNCPEVRVWGLGRYCWLELEGAGEILPVKRVGHAFF